MVSRGEPHPLNQDYLEPTLNFRQSKRHIPTKPTIAHPQFADYKKREETFKTYGWPPQMKQNRGDMALAGFVYTGNRDAVVCFTCGVGVAEWEPKDDPFEEHIHNSPGCPYVKSQKGRLYVNLVLARGPRFKWLKNQSTTNLQERVDMPECVVCLQQERTVAFKPCGHFATCVSCGFQVETCVVCREKITERIRIYTC